jgi:hypothetical protein
MNRQVSAPQAQSDPQHTVCAGGIGTVGVLPTRGQFLSQSIQKALLALLFMGYTLS